MEARFLLGYDIGTSGLKVGLFDFNGELVYSTTKSYSPSYYSSNRVEQDAREWWKAICEASRDLLNHNPQWKRQIKALSFSGQMMGCLPVDQKGEPLHPSLIWSDERSVKEAKLMSFLIGNDVLYKKTGQIPAPSFVAAKILWLKENEPEVYSKTYKVLNSKDYALYKFTGKFYTDPSDASGYNLYNLDLQEWDKDILDTLKIDVNILPEVVPSSYIGGEVTKEAAEETGLMEGTPVVVGGGDGTVAALGAGMVKSGDAYISLGTSAWFSLVSDQPILDEDYRTSVEVHVLPDLYCPNGTTFNGSEPLKWLKNQVLSSKYKNISYEEISELVKTVPPGSEDLLFLPYLQGEKSPYANPDATGVFHGLTLRHNRAHFIRAVMEGSAINLRLIYDIFTEQNLDISKLVMIGGGAASDEWVSIFADVFNMKVDVPKNQESSAALGAALLAGIGTGVYTDYSALNELVKIEKTIHPNPENFECYDRKKKQHEKLFRAIF